MRRIDIGESDYLLSSTCGITPRNMLQIMDFWGQNVSNVVAGPVFEGLNTFMPIWSLEGCTYAALQQIGEGGHGTVRTLT